MKRDFILYLVLILFLGACGAKNTNVQTVQSGDTYEYLSRQFKLQITQKDNLKLYSVSSKWFGTPYKIGGNTKKGIDCSGFAGVMYKDVYKKSLNRSSADIFKKNITKTPRSELSEGDLVFFRTDKGDKNTPNHVGIYLKEGKFVHASTSKGVMVNSLDEAYYKKTWVSGGKVK
ncbi:MAG: C40 family peptidase [Campylobacteraceae bacterium]|nr:C40 family peptidase [Campylobacteraceae bacterium]